MSALDESLIRSRASPESFERGRNYLRQGAVTALVRRGPVLEGEVEGGEPMPYRTRIELAGDGVESARCTCRFRQGGWCKHIVATLLAYLHDPQRVERHPALAESLQALSPDVLARLVAGLAERELDLADRIDCALAVYRADPAAPVEPGPFRRRVRALLRALAQADPDDAYWRAQETVGELRELLHPARALLDRDAGRDALAVLAAIADETVRGWGILEDADGGAGAFLAELAPLLTEALLSVEFTDDERRQWTATVDRWRQRLGGFDLGGALAAPQAAASEGWRAPPVESILQDRPAPAEDAAWHRSELTRARLTVLERRRRFDDYLRLARAEGELGRYGTMLARVGRLDEARAVGLESLTLAADALALARALAGQGDEGGALAVAAKGLELAGPKRDLAEWLKDAAREQGDSGLALRAALALFFEAPSLAAYLDAQRLADWDWPERRPELLARLREPPPSAVAAAADIFLRENLLDDAIRVAARSDDDALLARVADAVAEARPAWAARTALERAEAIIDEGHAARYETAVAWLRRAEAAYRVAGREADWQRYLADLRARHGRKFKLMALLER